MEEMKRVTFAARIKEGMETEFRKRLGMIWRDATHYLDDNKICNFSVWKMADLLFFYGEAEDDYSFTEDKIRRISAITETIENTITWLSKPGQRMQLVYHDYGIVRTSKELVRHRVFAAKLKEGCLKEYKRRHDKLIEQRGDTINYGPESNYSIWSDGNYIFGYDEIDTTMEEELTEEQKRQSIVWENRMLEIMEWITDDVDWITGERNAKSVCIARYR